MTGARLTFGDRVIGALIAGTSLDANYAQELSNLSTAGVVMMIEGSFVTLGLLAWFFIAWSKHVEERQALLDYAESKGLELDEGRAGRAVAAGRGQELAERLAERA